MYNSLPVNLWDQGAHIESLQASVDLAKGVQFREKIHLSLETSRKAAKRCINAFSSFGGTPDTARVARPTLSLMRGANFFFLPGGRPIPASGPGLTGLNTLGSGPIWASCSKYSTPSTSSGDDYADEAGLYHRPFCPHVWKKAHEDRRDLYKRGTRLNRNLAKSYEFFGRGAEQTAVPRHEPRQRIHSIFLNIYQATLLIPARPFLRPTPRATKFLETPGHLLVSRPSPLLSLKTKTYQYLPSGYCLPLQEIDPSPNINHLLWLQGAAKLQLTHDPQEDLCKFAKCNTEAHGLPQVAFFIPGLRLSPPRGFDTTSSNSFDFAASAEGKFY
ncbi:hypothetical protein C8F04DRAFT_1235081 [Mycena alexandri]|uniref:Uncharacterized protein n=1 Tax=Mycena alexandri TaxID=1745969 RepID=A0AAD6SSJ4_9AGAR|nr:hypothetical protein C8F04DRAFT_1235081 [Mycena alexandri]